MSDDKSLGPAHEYLRDAWQRSILFLDVLRQRGNIYREQQEKSAPNVLEFDAQYRTAIPQGTMLNSAVLRGGILRVDVSEELLQLSGDTLVNAIAQIVFTASEVEGVRGVLITADGEDQQWPVGNGELQAAPLTIYDYPGLLPSAQPDYPAVPSPTQP